MAFAETPVHNFISACQSGNDSFFTSEQSSVIFKTFGPLVSCYLLPVFQQRVLAENQLSWEMS